MSDSFVLYRYHPSYAAAVVFVIGFLLSGLGHIFHRNIRNKPTERSVSLAAPWERVMVVLYAVSALIMVRSIYRVAEYIQGSSGSLQGHEVFIYVFDATLMLVGCLVLNVFHSSQALREKGVYQSEMA
ncbi:uncharacterized protein BO80DRAFT_99218 [Aspergillus ibericus CBS 121593]|uniref:RTA1 domain protein n=1 Tax=Aspergillus ibericus CBS 121593 TaxID=1448316 RepID=A0A395GY07_9EURO|nr:hypothetical protein BO80DRAFT_99218 [Aspergillus ibericus CBS 121593]RAL00471.1 hypothetical protein BO80DRAFT_99218 [Aspergillus ibericus CBS 121593]